MTKISILVRIFILGAGIIAPTHIVKPAEPGNITADDIRAILEPIRVQFKLPAMGGAIVTSSGLQAVGTVGVRKTGTDIAVTDDDLWHLGSDTKAMTAAMIGSLVEKGRLRWETTVGEVFPEVFKSEPSPLSGVNLLHLLSHRAGLPSDPTDGWRSIPSADTIQGRRINALLIALKEKPVAAPGEKYAYSNFGYVLAGAMAEQVTGSSWEELIAAEIFRPLGMSSVGFGGVGTPGKIDQPWGHNVNGKPVMGNGPDMDNPPVLGPAGRVHCTLADWAKFVADQLRGARGESGILKLETYATLHTAPFGGNYALGWNVTGGGRDGDYILSHSGSNLMNFAVVWISPQKNLAVLIVTNQGGMLGEWACSKANRALIDRIRGSDGTGALSISFINQ